jgi:tetratricopeptide (TPR) repeat protein
MSKTVSRSIRIAIFAPYAIVLLAFLAVSPATLSGQGKAASVPAGNEPARAWEEPLVIPTYLVGPPEPNPIFYTGRSYQGAKGPIYPYPLLDALSDTRVDKAYRALWLENRYIKLCVLPEVGGRIFIAVDKTNGYDFFYRQHVIKPALIGMLGAWISGGVEWNIPHHHRATTFMTVDSLLENRPDGSATVWVGEIELRHRTKWVVGLTLRPDSSAVEVTTRIFNRTALAHSMLCFANAAVHANENYQVIFPPSTEVATFHAKNQFSRWPVSSEVFNSQDYTRGVDVSWWKSHRRPTSFFAFNAEEDFLAGYDHGKKAGVAFVGDHDVVPGKKLWTWGTGSEGKAWEKILTDNDGPYLELMIGSYSDNQPDYSWTQPGETRSVTQFWYPIRSLPGLKNANREAACGFEVAADGKVRVAFNTTSEVRGAKVIVKEGETVVLEDTADIGPERPYEKVMKLPAGAKEDALGLTLLAPDGREIVSYRPRPRKNRPLPAPVTPPPPPKDIPTVEELYLAGLRLEQFHNPALEPDPYYEEALRRDPGDTRVNTALGVLELKRGMYREAEGRFRTALERLTRNYTRPKDGEAGFYLGVALRAQGKVAEAGDGFARAAWDEAWTAAANYELATLACRSSDWASALDYLDRSLVYNAWNTRAMNLRSAVLRKLGRTEEALECSSACLRMVPLDHQARYESYLATSARQETKAAEADLKALVSLLGDSDANWLELAADYAGGGLWEDASSVLRVRGGQKRKARNPLVEYALAFYADKLGKNDEAAKHLALAASAPRGYVFPFQLEFIDILTWAQRKNPKDALAPYALGNLLYDLQPERAVEEWEKAASLDPSFATAQRNLGFAYARVRGDLPGAVSRLEKAVAAKPEDPRLYYELDVLFEQAGTALTKRLTLMENNHRVVAQRDDALSREIGLLIRAGRYARAIDLLTTHHFHISEGGGEVHNLWVEAFLARGRSNLGKQKPAAGLTDFERALEYPENLEVGPPTGGDGSPKIYFFIGAATAAKGDPTRAAEAFEKAAGFRPGWSEQSYYRGLALRKLGREAEANEVFDGLVAFAQERMRTTPGMDFFEKFGEKQSARVQEARHRFLFGLGLMGKGMKHEAAEEFSRALSLDPNLDEARRSVEELKK